MKVIQAKSAGFCYGVQRAVELAEQTARERGGCVMLGSIIHNAHVVQHLEQLGAHQGRRKSARATRYSSAPTARKSRSLAT